jgi:hypothetical protein
MSKPLVALSQWTWMMLYGNVGNWPAGLCQVYSEVKEEEVSGKVPQAVVDWCVLLRQQLLDGETILHEAYMVFDGELPTDSEDVQAIFCEGGDLLGTLHHGVACLQTYIAMVDYQRHSL